MQEWDTTTHDGLRSAFHALVDVVGGHDRQLRELAQERNLVLVLGTDAGAVRETLQDIRSRWAENIPAKGMRPDGPLHPLLWKALVAMAAESAEHLGAMGWVLEQLADAPTAIVQHFAPAANRPIRAGPPPGPWVWVVRFKMQEETGARLWRAWWDTPRLVEHIGIPMPPEI